MRRLERSRANRMLMGVCGGVAEYFQWNVDLVRVLWILSLLFGGVGLIPYIAAILLMPEGDPRAPRESEGPGRYIGLALIALGLALVLHRVGLPTLGLHFLPFWSWGLLLPLALLIGGALLVWPTVRETFLRSPQQRIQRSVRDRVLAGVAGGMAQSMRADPNLVRLAWVLGAVLTSGLLVLVYLALIFLLREEEFPVVAAPAGPPPPVPDAATPVAAPPAPRSEPQPPAEPPADPASSAEPPAEPQSNPDPDVDQAPEVEGR